MRAQISNHMHMFELVTSCCPLSLVEACTDDWTYQEQVAIVPLEHAAEPFMPNYGSWDSEIKKKITFILKRFQAIHRIRFGGNEPIVP